MKRGYLILVLALILIVATPINAQIPFIKLNETTNQTSGTYDSLIPFIELEIPGNMSMLSVNSSDYAEIWITAEGNMDDVSDISTSELTDDNTYVRVIGDTMTGDLNTTGKVEAENFHIQSGETYALILEGDNTEHTADRTLTFDLSDGDRKLKVYADEVILGDWFNQEVKTTSSPTFAGATIGNYQITERANLGISFQNLDSTETTFMEVMTKDGDTSDHSVFNIFGRGTPTQTTNIEYLQLGWIVTGPDYRIRTIKGGSGSARNLSIFTDTNTDQLLLGTGGEVYMAQAVDDALGNLRATYWDSATGQIGYDSSSIRYKENVENMTDETSNKIYDLRPVTFDKIEGAKDQIGLTAEEVNDLFPQCVFYKREEIWGKCPEINLSNGEDYYVDCIAGYQLEINKTTGKPIPEGINYECLISPAIKTIQNQENEIKSLKKELCMRDMTYSWCGK